MKTARTIRWIVVGLVAAIAVGAGATARRTFGGLAKARNAIPTTKVERGDVALEVITTGTLQTLRSAVILGPPVSGGTLEITRLLKTGTPVKSGDVVVTFDPSEQEYNLEQSRSDLEQADQEITKARDDAAVEAAQDQVDLLKDRFDVRRAQLEVSKNELVSALDAKKNQLALDEARRALAQLESDIKSHSTADEATITVNREKRQKALLGMQEAQRNIERMQAKSPIPGLVEVEKNYRAFGGIIFSGMALPDYHEGDQAYPGSVIARIVDPAQMEIQAKIGESDRANVKAGQGVQVSVRALEGKTFEGKIKAISSLASRGSFWQPGATSSFDVTVGLNQPDPQLRPGYTAEIHLSGNPLKNVLYLPPQAIFQKDGNPVVYARAGSAFAAHPVKIQYRTDLRVVVEGLKQGTEVALVNPEEHGPKVAQPAGPFSPAALGRGR